jgi:hypothetical protein
MAEVWRAKLWKVLDVKLEFWKAQGHIWKYRMCGGLLYKKIRLKV